jgi:hypothetical protein
MRIRVGEGYLALERTYFLNAFLEHLKGKVARIPLLA